MQCMGKTILSGAITSMMSAVFLLICNSHVLNTYGLLLCVTILASFLTSMVLLPALLFTFGPEKDQGMICQQKQMMP